jgi:Protein of unknown function (DUF1559)
MKQIALALHNYISSWDSVPPGGLPVPTTEADWAEVASVDPTNVA